MRRWTTTLICAVLAVAPAGCAERPGGGGPTPTAGPETSAPVGTPAPGPAPTTAAPGPTGPTGEYRVTYGWAVPSTPVTIEHRLNVPLPGDIPLPYLVEVRTGDHPDESPKYGRVSFYFRGAFPGYRLEYVRQVTADGSGDPVPLAGNSFLHIVFTPAQAHDNAGASTIRFAAPRTVGFPSLKAYAPAGDFEGQVSYGLGIAVAPGSDQVRQIRVGELRRSDGFFIVAVDVQE